ncbi:helix-turn-helix domain-containing protein [Serratia ureilytica]|uniref:helix-turn-helix domain-containing protein n=1 Tax=Serratia ureilytica TaxID=300181 RepID=UPI00313ED327
MRWEKEFFKVGNNFSITGAQNEKKIQDMILKHGREFSVEKNYEFFLCETDRQNIFYVNNGCICLGDNEKKSIIKLFPSPLIIGIREHKFQSRLSYKSLSACTGYFINKDLFLKKIKTENLCLTLAEYIGEYCDEIINSYALIHGKNSYVMIKQCIRELYTLPKNVREEVNLTSYIIKRTSLSRSGVMRIVSDLCTGEYIEIKNGKLEKIRHLPHAY